MNFKIFFLGGLVCCSVAMAQTQDEYLNELREFYPQKELCPATLPATGNYKSKSCLQGFQCTEKHYQIRATCLIKPDGSKEFLIKGLPLGTAGSSMRFDQGRWDKVHGLLILNYFDLMITTKQFTPRIAKLERLGDKLVIHYQILKDSTTMLEGTWTIEKSDSIFSQFAERHNTMNVLMKSEVSDFWLR